MKNDDFVANLLWLQSSMPYAMYAVLNAEWVVGFSWRFSSGLTGKEGAFTKANEWVQEELAYKQTWNAGTIQLGSAWSPKKSHIALNWKHNIPSYYKTFSKTWSANCANSFGPLTPWVCHTVPKQWASRFKIYEICIFSMFVGEYLDLWRLNSIK